LQHADRGSRTANERTTQRVDHAAKQLRADAQRQAPAAAMHAQPGLELGLLIEEDATGELLVELEYPGPRAVRRLKSRRIAQPY
jgi:hypothetical protein